MKGILILIDGLGDLDSKQLNDKTPLEVAHSPNLDYLATRGELGYMYPVKRNFVPESDEAIVSIFGNELISSTRGQLEARGAGLDLKRGDLSLRVNFATIDSLESGNIIDRRAGRTLTSAEAEILAKSLNQIKLQSKFQFVSTVQHRAVLVFRGGFSDNISGNDLTYSKGKPGEIKKVGFSKALDEEDNSVFSANTVNEFLKKAYDILKDHPVNKQRIAKGLLPANYLLVRDPGVELPRLKQYKKWMSINYMPLEMGFSRLSGMKTFSFNYPKLKSVDAYENLYSGLAKACSFVIEVLKKNHKNSDYAYIHIKETDYPGHDNKPLEKKQMIEYIDKTLFKFLKDFCLKNNINLVVTGDHSTPCKLKGHSSDPVPVLFYKGVSTGEKRFNEKECRKGKLGEILGKNLLKIVGFNK